jgi:hypothetical protein
MGVVEAWNAILRGSFSGTTCTKGMNSADIGRRSLQSTEMRPEV